MFRLKRKPQQKKQVKVKMTKELKEAIILARLRAKLKRAKR